MNRANAGKGNVPPYRGASTTSPVVGSVTYCLSAAAAGASSAPAAQRPVAIMTMTNATAKVLVTCTIFIRYSVCRLLRVLRSDLALPGCPQGPPGRQTESNSRKARGVTHRVHPGSRRARVWFFEYHFAPPIFEFLGYRVPCQMPDRSSVSRAGSRRKMGSACAPHHANAHRSADVGTCVPTPRGAVVGRATSVIDRRRRRWVLPAVSRARGYPGRLRWPGRARAVRMPVRRWTEPAGYRLCNTGGVKLWPGRSLHTYMALSRQKPEGASVTRAAGER